MNALFNRFERGQKFANLSSEEFVSVAAEFLGELMRSTHFVRETDAPNWHF
jgi:hypothetical protein